MTTGKGFRSCSIPDTLVAVLEDMSLIDYALDRCRLQRLDDGNFSKLMNARDAVQHHMLSLPSWEDLDEKARSNICRPVYEGTRLTALLYSNAVVYPEPPHNGWHIKLVERLEVLLCHRIDEDWSAGPSTLLTWILVICSIAAYRTSREEGLERALRRHIAQRSGPRSKAAVREVVKEYLWSDNACGQGLSIVWEALRKLDMTDRSSETI